MRTLAGLALAALLVAPSLGWPCSPPPMPPPAAIPRTGTTNVSTATSIYLLAGSRPSMVKLTAGGSDVAVGPLYDAIGSGLDDSHLTQFWNLGVGILMPSTEYALTVNGQEVTRFTTASGYDKQQGTPPTLNALRLWRVRYPLSEIQSGDCVFAEYQGFIEIDWTPGSIPNTKPDGTLYTLSLYPKTGGSSASFVFTGNTDYHGHAPVPPDYLPPFDFSPELDAVREYCVTLTAAGDGDQARGTMRAGPVCANVTEIVKAGAGGSDGGVATDGAAVPAETHPGCAVGGRGGDAAGWLGAAVVVGLAITVRRRRRA